MNFEECSIFYLITSLKTLFLKVMQFIGDSRMSHSLYCFSNDENGETSISRAHIQRIHKGKRAATDVCSWSGHIAECHVAQAFPKSIR